MTTIHILLYDGFDEVDAVGPYEVFQYAAESGADVDVSLVTLTDRKQVAASHGLRVVPDGVLPAADEDGRPDILLVPGGGWEAREPVDSAWAEAQNGEIPDAEIVPTPDLPSLVDVLNQDAVVACPRVSWS